MWETVAYSLLAVAGVLALVGGLTAIWRLTPRHAPSKQALEALQRVETLDIVFQGFADQYELSVNRNAQKIRRLRRSLAQERGEDEEDEPVPSPQPTAPAPVQTLKDELRRRAFSGGKPG